MFGTIHWLGLVWVVSVLAAGAAELRPPGNRPEPPGVHALVGATVIPRPGTTIEGGTVLIRDGWVAAVGKEMEVPADARVWDLRGRVIYAGFIDPLFSARPRTNGPPPRAREGGEEARLRSGRLDFFGAPGGGGDPGAPGPGSEVESVTPQRRMALEYSPEPNTVREWRELGFTAVNVVPEKGLVRGTSALVLLGDGDPNELVLRPDVFEHISFTEEGQGGREAPYPQSLMGMIAAVRQLFLDAGHLRAGQEYQAQHPEVGRRAAFDPSLEALLPVVARRRPVLFEPGSALMVDRAARLAREFDLDFALVSCGQEWRRPDIAEASAASFIVRLDFPELPRLPEEEDWDQVSLDALRAWDWAAENAALLRRRGRMVALTVQGLSDRRRFRRNLQWAMDRGLSETDALAGLTTVPARLCGLDDRLGTIAPGHLANLTVVEGRGYFDPAARVEAVWVDGKVYPARPASAFGAGPGGTPPRAAGADRAAASEGLGSPPPDKTQEEKRDLRRRRVAREPLRGRGVLAEPPALLIQHATVWTCGPQGRLENADVLVAGGKIRAVGAGLSPGEPAPLVVDGRGLHVTPGLIDAHSHSMVLGKVNEATLPSTAMVRIGDVVNSETANIYWQLAGGLTAANLLHGSANPIGGQNAVIKLKDGSSPEELKIPDAPSGIKFALGENVKQANWGDRATNRFPQTRMGVPVFMSNRFTAARQYAAEWDRYRRAPSGSLPSPRRDLELEAITEILRGERLIHCHSYRQDEILAFLRVMEGYGVRVATLQHVLEGYKVADEMARHGAGGSCFSDWWAYKYEVIDAIPYAGSLMHARGVLVSFNSDSSDHARRLNTEAAKAVKYGGTAEEDALRFVTLNPARQLGIDHRTGSLEPGKDADWVLWSGSPLDSRSVCLQTWIEGKKYFDRERDGVRTRALEEERAALLSKARQLAEGGRGAGPGEDLRTSFFQGSLEHRYDGVDRHCQEEDR